MVMVQLSVLIMVIMAQSYTCDKFAEIHIHTGTQMGTAITNEIRTDCMN